jgi:hypothetical protein
METFGNHFGAAELANTNEDSLCDKSANQPTMTYGAFLEMVDAETNIQRGDI